VQIVELIRTKCSDKLSEKVLAELEATIHRNTRDGLAALEQSLESRRLEITKGANL
jgi:hypothetical protein